MGATPNLLRLLRMRVTFLLGAGVSLAAGMPSTEELTRLITSGERVWHHTDHTYYVTDNPPPALHGEPERIRAITTFLHTLKEDIEAYWRRSEIEIDANYEEIYYVVNQIEDGLSAEYENPALEPLIDKLVADDRLFRVDGTPGLGDEEQLELVARETDQYVREITAEHLRRPLTTTEHLACLLDALNDDHIEEVNVITLNHDTGIEQAAEAAGVVLVDGFAPTDEGVRIWQPEVFDTGQPKLLKPHGSVDWFAYRRGDSLDEVIAQQRIRQDRWRLTVGGVEHAAIEDASALILVGSFNKILRYSSRIYFDIHYRLHEILTRSDVLVVSGYGFGDKAINSRIIHWVAGAPTRQLIVLHRDAERLRQYARGSIAFTWALWVDAGRLALRDAWLSESDWGTVRELAAEP